MKFAEACFQVHKYRIAVIADALRSLVGVGALTDSEREREFSSKSVELGVGYGVQGREN